MRGRSEAGLEPAEGKGSPRKVYRVTGAGRRAYLAGVTAALSRPQRLFPLLQQGLAGLPYLDPADAAQLRERLAVVRRKNVSGLPDQITCMFEYSERMVSSELEWVEELARRLERKAKGGKR